jgi:polyhydroxybutyrate depolymerase
MERKRISKTEIVWLVGLLIVVLLIQSACRILPAITGDDELSTYDPALITETVVHEGAQRQVVLFVPFPLSQEGVSVVFMLHGDGADPAHVMVETTEERWNELAFREKFIMVYPDGWNDTWNDCRGDRNEPSSDRDDVGFILFLLEWVASRYPVDFGRVFVAGHDSGGMMAFRLAQEASDVFAAAFSNAGPLPAENVCTAPDSPVSILYMAGTEDPFVPFEGGALGLSNGTHGRVLSAEMTVAVWLDWLDLSGTPTIVRYPDKVKKDQSELIAAQYEDRETALWFIRVEGGGHAWPGAAPFSMMEAQTNGPKNRDINAADIAWAFFEMVSDLR